MSFVKNLIMRVGADVTPLQKDLNKAKSTVSGFNKYYTDSSKKMAQSEKESGGAFIWGKMKMVAAVSAASTALFKLGKASITNAMNVVESENLFNVSLGSMRNAARAWSEDLQATLGLNGYEIRKNVGLFYNMTTAMGLTRDQAYKVSTGITQLAYDMSSFYNISFDEMFIKIQAGLSGEIEPLRRIGVIVNETATKQWAYANGIGVMGKELTESQKVLARYGLIMSQTTNAQGDMARTITSPLNQLRILQAQLKLASTAMGQAFMPIVQIVLPILTDFAKELARVAGILAQFTSVLFGYNSTQAITAISAADAAAAQAGLGDSITETGKAVKGALAGFDEINQLQQDMADTTPDDGAGDTTIPGIEKPPEINNPVPESISVAANNAKLAIEGLAAMAEDFYNNWGIKDLIKGIRDGFNNFDTSAFLFNLSSIGQNIVKILTETEPGVQEASRSFGRMVGVAIGGGISIYLSTLDIVTLGIKKFYDDNTPRIIAFANETSSKLTETFNNVSATMSSIFSVITANFSANRETLSDSVSQTMTTMLNFSITTGTIITGFLADTTGNIKSFFINNKPEIQSAVDGMTDIYTKGVDAITTATDIGLAGAKTAWETWGSDLNKTVQGIFADIGVKAVNFFNENIKPAFTTGLDDLKKVIEDKFPGITDNFNKFMGKMTDALDKLYKAIKPVIDIFEKTFFPIIGNALKWFKDTFVTTFDRVLGVINDLLVGLTGIIDFFTGIFTGNLKQAFEGMKKVFISIINIIVAVVTAPLNAILTGLNFIIRGINQAFGSAIKEFEMFKWHWEYESPYGETTPVQTPGATEYARGGIISSPTLAMMGEGGKKEAVVPLENTSFVDTLASAVGNAVAISTRIPSNQGSNGPQEIIIQIDSVKLARVLLPAIDKEKARTGNAILQGV